MNKLLISFFIVSSFFFVACQKSTVGDGKGNKTVSVDSLLISKTWQVAHLTFVQNNTLYYYNRGALNNTANFDIDYLSFKKDSTGTYTAGPNSYKITWKFTDQQKSLLQYIIYNYSLGAPANGVNSTIFLENVNVTDSTFKYVEIYTNSDGNSVISSVKRVPASY